MERRCQHKVPPLFPGKRRKRRSAFASKGAKPETAAPQGVFARVRRKPGSPPPSLWALSNEQLLAALRLPVLAAVGAFLTVDAAFKALNRREAKRLCRERRNRILTAKEVFIGKLEKLSEGPSWDENACRDAVSEFAAARADEDREWTSAKALSVHERAREKRESAWRLWTEEVVGELMQLAGIRTVLPDFKTPAVEILGTGIDEFAKTLRTRRSLAGIRRGMASLAPAPDVRRTANLPPAPGEWRKRRKGAPIRRLCESSLLPPPEPEALLAAWAATRGHGKVAEKIRLGSMLLDAEASVDSSLIRDSDGEIVGRRPGLKGWIETRCPQLMAHYGTLMKFRRLAAAFREEHGMGDPVPAAALVEETSMPNLPRAGEMKLAEARKAAKETLSGTEAKTATALMRELAARRDRRQGVIDAVREATAGAWRKKAVAAAPPGATAEA